MLKPSQYQARWREKMKKDARRRLLNHLRNAAARRGVEFNLQKNDIDTLLVSLPEFCPVFPNIKLVYEIGYKGDDHAEVDRINNDHGYISGNIRFISRRANRIKSDATAQELLWLWRDAQRIHNVEAF